MGDIIVTEQQFPVEPWFAENAELSTVGSYEVFIAVVEVGEAVVYRLCKGLQRFRRQFVVVVEKGQITAGGQLCRGVGGCRNPNIFR